MTDAERRRLRRIGVFVFRAVNEGRHGWRVEDCSGWMWFPTEQDATDFLKLAGLLD